MLTKLDVDALISKTQALKAVCTPGMALPLCFLMLLPTQITEAPFVICSTSWHSHTAEVLYGLSLSPVTACFGSLQHWDGAFVLLPRTAPFSDTQGTICSLHTMAFSSPLVCFDVSHV